MKIEVVEFYPFEMKKGQKNPFLEGTLHIYLCDLDIDIRGIYCIKKKERWLIKPPTRKGTDYEQNCEVIYPIFNFASMAKQKEFMEDLKKAGILFLKKKYPKV